MSAAHTPGPWQYTQDHGSDFELKGADGTLVVSGCGCCGSPNLGANAEADARLIAASPDLLDALEICAETLASFVASGMAHGDSVIGKNFTRARAAIAKATGEPA